LKEKSTLNGPPHDSSALQDGKRKPYLDTWTPEGQKEKSKRKAKKAGYRLCQLPTDGSAHQEKTKNTMSNPEQEKPHDATKKTHLGRKKKGRTSQGAHHD